MTEAFSFLEVIDGLEGFRADFVGKVPGVEVDGERDEVLARLLPGHRARLRERFGVEDWWRAEQVHGDGVAVVAAAGGGELAGVDGLVTDRVGEVLGIYVADCGVIWLADRGTGAIGLVHSGRVGSELGILTRAIEKMGEVYGTKARDVVGLLGPCIRPPHYEVDFAAEIGRQACELGLGEFHDCGIDTASDPAVYYSYRMEKGRTGRMLGLLMRA